MFKMMKNQYSKLNSAVYIVLVISSIFITLSAYSVAAFEYEDKAFHYKVQLPEGWIQLDQNTIDNANKAPSASGGNAPNFATGFVNGKSSQKIYPAYILIEHNPVRVTFDTLVERFAGKSISSNQKLPDMAKQSSFSEPIINNKYKLIIFPSTQKLESIGTVKALSAMFVGRSGIVQLYLYSLEQEYSANFPIFTSIIESFSFETGYGPGTSDISEDPSAISVLSKTLLGAGVGVGIVWLIKRRKKVS